jgi:two-component system, LytTR family, response regulator
MVMASSRLKAAIIDDEMHCIKTLSYLLNRQHADIELVFTSTDSSTAKALVEVHKPDILFLDIEMPVLNGLQFLSQFSELPFKVIFTTAYDQYAIRAIRLNALDYLLKPIDKKELKDAVEKFGQERDNTSKEQINHLHLFKEKKIAGTLALSTSQGLLFVKTGEILYLEADDCYTHVMMKDGKKHVVSKTLGNFDDILTEEKVFFRAHKSFLINLSYIKQYIRGDGGDIIMQDDRSIALSRNKKEEFLLMFAKV